MSTSVKAYDFSSLLSVTKNTVVWVPVGVSIISNIQLVASANNVNMVYISGQTLTWQKLSATIAEITSETKYVVLDQFAVLSPQMQPAILNSIKIKNKNAIVICCCSKDTSGTFSPNILSECDQVTLDY